MPADLAAWTDLFARMGIATVAGAALGLERSRQDRAITGLRTLSLVGLASCIAVLAMRRLSAGFASARARPRRRPTGRT